MCEPEWPQPGRERMIVPPPVALHGTGMVDPEAAMSAKLDDKHVMMMGDNPALPRMPKSPSLMDFFPYASPTSPRGIFSPAPLALSTLGKTRKSSWPVCSMISRMDA